MCTSSVCPYVSVHLSVNLLDMSVKKEKRSLQALAHKATLDDDLYCYLDGCLALGKELF